jgi:hypothetical protein
VNYQDYLSSLKWNRRKHAFYRTNEKICAACASETRLLVHHLSYKHLGHEPDDDLVILCWPCHEELHTRFGSRRWDLREKSYEFIDEKRQSLEMNLLVEFI